MATVFEVICVHEDARYAGQAARAVFELVDRLEQALSRFVPNSDVSRASALGPGEATRVGAAALECLGIAQNLFSLTSGAFDVSLGTGLDGLELDPDAFTVRSARGGVRLDLGGIGKGYAVDRAAELLEEWDVRRALVHGGFSSVVALEGPDGGPGWPLTLRDPRGGATLARVVARQLALSASGTRKGDHVLDPRSGRPVEDRAAWVAVPRSAEAVGQAATVADALTTAFLLLPRAAVEGLVGSVPGTEAWLLPGPLHLVSPRS
jgi:thiamine biosynthesis lipoprotein